MEGERSKKIERKQERKGLSSKEVENLILNMRWDD
jgi:hypothetical protein